MTHWRALPHIPAELLAGNDGDGRDFAVSDFGLWVVALVEYVEQVVEDAESRDVFVQHGCPPCAWGDCTRTRGKT
jgi:hypothetical protein